MALTVRRLEDPHNLGAILRTADATGMDALSFPDISVKLNATVAKVSTGASSASMQPVVNLSQTIDALKKPVIGTGLEADGIVYYNQTDDSGKSLWYWVGRKGISRLVKEKCDFWSKSDARSYYFA